MMPYTSLVGMQQGDHEKLQLIGMPGSQPANVWAAWWEEGSEGGGEEVGKRSIKRLRAEQVRALEASFAEEAKLEPERKVELAQQLGLQPRQVAVWFQNRRARSKSKQLELDFATLSSHYHSLLDETHRLRGQVAQLTSELEHVKRGALTKIGVLAQCSLIDARKGEESLKGASSKKDKSSHDKMTTILNHVRQASPSCSNYSVTIDSESSNTMNHKDASAYDSGSIEELEYSCLPHDWIKENLIATHQVSTSGCVTMQSHDLVLEEPTFTNNVAMDPWLWSLPTYG